jgi:hypothetical protein
VKDKIREWLNYILRPNTIGKFAICPFAAKTISEDKYKIQELHNLTDINNLINEVDINTIDVVIYYLINYELYTPEFLGEYVIELNKKFNNKDIVVLDSDPRVPFVINGITTTFSDCYLILIQGLSELNAKSKILKQTDYYSYWTRQQLDEVVTWREQQ